MKALLIATALLITGTLRAQDTTRIPYKVAKQIAVELVECDGIKKDLRCTQDELTATQQVVVVKESIIAQYIKKELIYDDRIKNEQLKFNTQQTWVTQLTKRTKVLKTKLLFVEVTAAVIITLVTMAYFTK
jgi:hypothetical protein